MSFSSDIQAVTASSTDQVLDGRTRLAGLYFVSTSTAGSIVLRSGGVSGSIQLDLATPAVAGNYDLIIPDDGILFKDGIHATLTNVTSITLLYVGGAPA